MFVPLATTYEPLRAQRAAGVLRAHGIAAWVTAAVSSGSGETAAAGECLVMVKEGEAEQATRLLDVNPPSAESRGGGAHTTGKPLSLRKSIGYGIVQGAVWLPLLAVAFFTVLRVLAALRWASAAMMGHLTILTRALSEGLFSLILTGAAIGLIAGFGTCLLSNYRHGGKTGIAFVGFIVLLLALPELLYLLLR
jgi:hypothetical protein